MSVNVKRILVVVVGEGRGTYSSLLMDGFQIFKIVFNTVVSLKSIDSEGGMNGFPGFRRPLKLYAKVEGVFFWGERL